MNERYRVTSGPQRCSATLFSASAPGRRAFPKDISIKRGPTPTSHPTQKTSMMLKLVRV